MVSLSPKRTSPSSRLSSSSSSLLRQSPTHRSSSASSASHFFKDDNNNDDEDAQKQQRRCNGSSTRSESQNNSSSTLLMYPRVSNPNSTNSNNTAAVTPSRKSGAGSTCTTSAAEESSNHNNTGFLFLPRMYNKSASFSPSNTTSTYKSVMSRFRKMKSAPSCTNNATTSSTSGNGNPSTTTKGTTVDLLFPTNTNSSSNKAKKHHTYGDENTRHAMMELATDTRNMMSLKELEMPSMMKDGDGKNTPVLIVADDAPPPAPDSHTTPPTTTSKVLPSASSIHFKTPPSSNTYVSMKKGAAAAGSSTESGSFKKWPGSEGSITSAPSFQSPIQHQSPSLAGCSVLALQRDMSKNKHDSTNASKGVVENDAAAFARQCKSFDDHHHHMIAGSASSTILMGGASTTPRSVRATFAACHPNTNTHPHTSRVNHTNEEKVEHNPKRSASSGHLAPSLAGCSVLAMTNKASRRNSQTNSFKHTLRKGLTRLSSSFDSNDERNHKDEQGHHGDDPLSSESNQHTKGRKNKAEKGTNRHHKNHDNAHHRKMDRRGSHGSYQGTFQNKNSKKQGHNKKSSNHNKSHPAMHQRRRSSCPDLAAAAADAIAGIEAVYTSKEEEDESKEYSDGELSDYYVEDNDACFSFKNNAAALTELTLLIQEERWDALRLYAGTKQGMRELRNQLQASLRTTAADVEEQVSNSSGSASSSDNLLQMALTFDPPKEFIELIRMECPSITHIVNAQGQTPLHIAAAWGASSEVMQTLIQWAPHHVMALDPQGNTPMHLLCGVGWPYLQEEAVGAVDLQERRQKFEQVLALMIQVCPQSVSLSNTEGITPLQYLPTMQASEWICRSLTSQVMQAKQVLLMKANAQAQATLEAKKQELEEMRLLQIQRYYQEQQQQQQLHPPHLDPYPNNGDED